MSLYSALQEGPFFIAGPCVIESEALLHTVAQTLVQVRDTYKIPVVFKASFDKANRTALSSYRGPGMEAGLAMLAEIKATYDLPITTDIHDAAQAAPVAAVADILQIPAFLCRQTDLLVAAANTNAIVNIKKAQFLSGVDMYYPTQKVVESGNQSILLTERGNVYGYNNLVVDFRNIADMKAHGYPVIMDCTHAVQRPGGGGGFTSGNRDFVPAMAKAAKAFGANGYFMEVHPNPDEALSDGSNQLYLRDFSPLVEALLQG